jgi:hypothetical protein
MWFKKIVSRDSDGVVGGGRVRSYLIALESCIMVEPPVVPASLSDQDGLLNGIEAELKTLIEELEPPPPSQRGRGALPVLPAMCLWAGMLVCFEDVVCTVCAACPCAPSLVSRLPDVGHGD